MCSVHKVPQHSSRETWGIMAKAIGASEHGVFRALSAHPTSHQNMLVCWPAARGCSVSERNYSPTASAAHLGNLKNHSGADWKPSFVPWVSLGCMNKSLPSSTFWSSRTEMSWNEKQQLCTHITWMTRRMWKDYSKSLTFLFLSLFFLATVYIFGGKFLHLSVGRSVLHLLHMCCSNRIIT